jgi:hypothetical protein
MQNENQITFKTIRATKENIQYRLVFFNGVEVGELIKSSSTKNYHFRATTKVIEHRNHFIESSGSKEIKKLILDNFINN